MTFITCRNVFRIIAVLCWAALLPPSLLASDPPKEPMLRLETGMHTAKITRVVVDRSETTLVTASNDKTVRVWDLSTGALKTILRVPIGQGNEGKLYSVAVSTDGRTVAAGGYTGYDWDKQCSIYIFDLPSSTLKHHITGLGNAISHLAFSRDGSYLAASLVKANGIRVYSTKDWREAARDTDYGDSSYCADFDAVGRLVTTSYDGHIRLYDNRFRLITKVKAPGGNQPYSAVFAPDGDLVAVGYSNNTRVDVFSGRDLSHSYSPDTAGVNNGLIVQVAWSLDGRHLLAGGNYYKNGGCPIRRWDSGGRGAFEDLKGAGDTITAIQCLSDGRTVFGAADPAWGILDPSGRRERYVTAGIADFRDNQNGFLLSPDARKVRFGYEHWGKRPAVFDVAENALSPEGDPAGLMPPVINYPGIAIADWKYTFAPKLNGSSLVLSKYERSKSLAITPDGGSFILGTSSYLRRFDNKGNALWKIPARGEVWAVNVSGDGLTVVAATGDGTINWYRMSDGQEVLTLFPRNDGRRWVLWTASGYYAASAGGDDLFGWHVNRGRDQAPDFFAASQFRDTYYRPDVVARVLETLDEDKALALADADAGRKQKDAVLTRRLPPVVTIVSPEDGVIFTDPELTVRYAVRSPGGEPITGLKILVDGRPLPGQRGITVAPANAGAGSLTLTLPERDSEISLIAENRFAASEPATVRVLWKGRSPSTAAFVIKPKLYVLAVGVGDYQRKDFALTYPAKDARDFAEVLKRQNGKLYRQVSVKVLTDEKATMGDVLDGLDWIEKETTDKDVAVIFLAGHGVNDRDGDYYFLPQNADPDRLRRTGVPYSTIKDVASGLPGKVLFFIDTCHSGDVMGKRRGGAGDIIAVVNDLSASENGVVVFAASTGSQYSLEDSAWGNGAFTKALVEAFSGEADFTKDGKITINEMDLYVSERVKKLTNGRQTPTTTKPKTVQDFPVAVK